jgi:hypothetical protein
VRRRLDHEHQPRAALPAQVALDRVGRAAPLAINLSTSDGHGFKALLKKENAGR